MNLRETQLNKRSNSENGTDQYNPRTFHKLNKLFAFENTYHDTDLTDKASHKEIASPSPAVL